MRARSDAGARSLVPHRPGRRGTRGRRVVAARGTTSRRPWSAWCRSARFRTWPCADRRTARRAAPVVELRRERKLTPNARSRLSAAAHCPLVQACRRCGPPTLPLVDLLMRDPAPQRLSIDPELLTDPRVRPRPRRWVLPRLQRQPGRPLTQLIGVLLGAAVRRSPWLDGLRQTRHETDTLRRPPIGPCR